MDRRYGLRGTIVPTDPWRGHHESFPKGHFTIEINDGVLEIGFDEEDLAVQARALIDQYCAVKAFEMGARYAIDLNQSWEQHPGGAKSIAVSLTDRLQLSGQLGIVRVTATQTGVASIIQKAYDSRDLSSDTTLFEKCDKDPALAEAIRYFSKEVVTDDRPLYGIYKALEVLTKALGKTGRAELGRLAGFNEKYVQDVMGTTNTVRHSSAGTQARQLLSDNECRSRAKVLITAYANSIQ